jgi:hypothetical protein
MSSFLRRSAINSFSSSILESECKAPLKNEQPEREDTRPSVNTLRPAADKTM